MTPPNCIAAAAGTPLSAVSAASAATGVPVRLEAQSRDGGFQGYSASGIALHAGQRRAGDCWKSTLNTPILHLAGFCPTGSGAAADICSGRTGGGRGRAARVRAGSSTVWHQLTVFRIQCRLPLQVSSTNFKARGGGARGTSIATARLEDVRDHRARRRAQLHKLLVDQHGYVCSAAASVAEYPR